jgi:hypothetical protein
VVAVVPLAFAQYKDFLDRLTPVEWFEQQRQLKKDRQIQRRQARMDAKRQAWEVSA